MIQGVSERFGMLFLNRESSRSLSPEPTTGARVMVRSAALMTALLR